MAYVNKTHKINFALDDNDFEIFMKLRVKYGCTAAELFRKLLRLSNHDVAMALIDLQKEVQEIRQDLINVRS